jgi:hypothetical protein
MKILEPFIATSWFRDDPRYHINKRAKIIILYSDHSGFHKKAAIGEVNVNDGWYIGIISDNPELRSSIDSGDDWPEGWVWTFQPK